jgi:hypothetical protein
VNVVPNSFRNQKQCQRDSATYALLNSLKDSNVSPKMKIAEEEGIRACCLTCSTFGVRKVC